MSSPALPLPLTLSPLPVRAAAGMLLGIIFLVLLPIQESVLPCVTYAPSNGTGRLFLTANTVMQGR